MKQAAAPAELSREYLWAFPGAPLRIHIRVAAVSKIRDYLLKGYNSDPALRRERGGLLLGAVRTNNVDITDFEPFRPDRTERNFVLSSSEKELLGITLEKRNAQTSVVGYFRSDFRKGVRMYEEDLALAKQFFSHPAQVFLIVHADKDQTPDAGFFFWDGGTIFADATFMQFPFDERLLPAQNPEPAPVPAPAASTVASEVASPAVQHAHQPPRPRRSLKLWKLLLWIAAISGVGAGVYASLPYLTKKFEPPKQAEDVPPKTVVNPSPAGLSVSQQGKNVEVTWDSQLPALADARIGVLTIKDGDWQAELPLTKVQLQMNKLIYPPKTDQLEITLEVFAASGKSTREAAMFVRQPSVRWRSVPTAPPPVTQPAGAARVQTPAEPPESTPAPIRTFEASKVNRPKATPAPALVTEAPPSAQVPLERGLKVPEFLVPSGQQQVPKFSEPPKPVALALQPPRPTQQVKPIVPPSAIAMLKRTVDIQVRVAVDEKGKVVGTQAIGPAAGLYHYLATYATQAARNWKFEPAQRGSTPMASEIVLHFLFEPGK